MVLFEEPLLEYVMFEELMKKFWIVCQVDSEMALEFATQSGMADAVRDTIYLRTLDSKRTFAPDLHNSVCVLRLFSGL